MAPPTSIHADPAVDDRVMAIVVDVLCVEPERSVPKAYLYQDLGADSLDLVEIEVALEEAFNLSFSCYESGTLTRCSTIADVSRLVARMLQRRSDAGEAA